jgi:hypothetical protein
VILICILPVTSDVLVQGFLCHQLGLQLSNSGLRLEDELPKSLVSDPSLTLRAYSWLQLVEYLVLLTW